ncbi:putative integral membrane protein [Hydrogenimonas sp.]|nr:putative integral membrane protein [Hydrogenimonas sp.]
MEMNWFDIVTGSLIVLIGIKGIFNGLIKELAGLVGIVLGVWLASLFASEFGKWLGASFLHIDSESALTMIGFLVLLALIWTGCIIAGVIIAKLVSLSGLGMADRVLGLLFASAKVFIIIAVIVYALSNIDLIRKNTRSFTDSSLLYPLFIKAGDTIVHIDTDSLAEKAGTVGKSTKETIQNGVEVVKKRLEPQDTKETDEKE